MVDGRHGAVVITGGTQGIGRATAALFARRGWPVAVLGRSQIRLDSTAAELRAHGNPVLALPVDVADASAVDAAADRIEAELGPIAVWINNAMATVIAPAAAISPDEFRRVTDVTYHGQVFGTLAALRHMRPRGRGHIVQISSGLAIRSAPLQAAYCGAKRAVTGFTDSLRAELLHDGVKVELSVVYLPAVNTPQFNLARNHTGQAQNAPDPVYDPRLCAEAIMAVVQSPVRDVWVGRSVLEMATAQTILPNIADQQAAKMWDSQLRAGPPPHPEGTMFEPGTADPGIDGPFADRVKPTRTEFFTSRTRDAVEAGVSTLSDLVQSGADALRRMAGRPE